MAGSEPGIARSACSIFNGLNDAASAPTRCWLAESQELCEELGDDRTRTGPGHARHSQGAASNRSPTKWMRPCSAPPSTPSLPKPTTPAMACIEAETGLTLVQGKSGLPIFVGVMAFGVKAVIDKAKAERRALRQVMSGSLTSPMTAVPMFPIFKLVQTPLLQRCRTFSVFWRRSATGMMSAAMFPATTTQSATECLSGRHADPAG